jgi:uncharacterized protein YacL
VNDLLNKLLRIFISFLGIAIGPGIVFLVFGIINILAVTPVSETLQIWVVLLIYVASGVLSGIIFLLLSKWIANMIERGIHKLESVISGASPVRITSGVIGLIIGLVIAVLLSVLIGSIPVKWISLPLTVIVYIIFGFMGWNMGFRKQFDFALLFGRGKKGEPSSKEGFVAPKILDTSVIIDGRIFDISKTGIFEGDIVIPEFVLVELQHIADSADSMKRTKGRRGLDILSKMQTELDASVRISDIDFDDTQEVDAKLIKMAKLLNGKIVTTDYNLNKVAAVHKVDVFNINELSNAVKPVLLPGEELKCTIIKDGKEQRQGIAYLDDGTMIVVEGGRGRIGEELLVVVTSVLQTAAGRMIFAKIK